MKCTITRIFTATSADRDDAARVLSSASEARSSTNGSPLDEHHIADVTRRLPFSAGLAPVFVLAQNPAIRLVLSQPGTPGRSFTLVTEEVAALKGALDD